MMAPFAPTRRNPGPQPPQDIIGLVRFVVCRALAFALVRFAGVLLRAGVWFRDNAVAEP